MKTSWSSGRKPVHVLTVKDVKLLDYSKQIHCIFDSIAFSVNSLYCLSGHKKYNSNGEPRNKQKHTSPAMLNGTYMYMRIQEFPHAAVEWVLI